MRIVTDDAKLHYHANVQHHPVKVLSDVSTEKTLELLNCAVFTVLSEYAKTH